MPGPYFSSLQNRGSVQQNSRFPVIGTTVKITSHGVDRLLPNAENQVANHSEFLGDSHQRAVIESFMVSILNACNGEALGTLRHWFWISALV